MSAILNLVLVYKWRTTKIIWKKVVPQKKKKKKTKDKLYSYKDYYTYWDVEGLCNRYMVTNTSTQKCV